MEKADVQLLVLNVPVTIYKFSGGELHVKLPEPLIQHIYNRDIVDIHVRMNSSDAIMATLLVTDAIRQLCIVNPIIDLIMDYTPYARQDRLCDKGEAFSLKVLAGLINSQNYNSVFVLDAHSDVAPALINNCFNMSAESAILRDETMVKLFEENDFVFVAPDAGAGKKVFKITKAISDKVGKEFPLVQALKVRNPQTGQIISTEVYSDELNGKHCMIFDDICDGGRTFIELSKVLREKGATSVSLYVSHGIFSAGFDELRQHINHIYIAFNLRHDLPKEYVTMLGDKE